MILKGIVYEGRKKGRNSLKPRGAATTLRIATTEGTRRGGGVGTRERDETRRVEKRKDEMSE